MKKIFITGHSGLLGNSVKSEFEKADFHVLTKKSSELDLRNFAEVNNYLNEERPDGVILCAARVGGIGENTLNSIEMITDNINIQYSTLRAAEENKIKNLIFISSAAVYPKDRVLNQEEDIFSGYPSPEHIQYALAKISAMEFVRKNKLADNNWISIIPTNIYGEKDKWDLSKSHVISALIMKIVNAKKNNLDEVSVWGTGNAKREFLYVDDAASAVFKSYLNIGKAKYDRYNLGSRNESSIKSLVYLISEICDYRGRIKFDVTKPEGPQERKLDISRLLNYIEWREEIDLRSGLQRCIDHYMKEVDLNL